MAVYEAEDAALTNMGIDSAWAGFTGTGVANSNNNGADEHCTFTLTPPAAGQYQIMLRYGLATAPINRRVIVNSVTIGDLTMMSTVAWSIYTVSAPVRITLTAGSNTIDIANIFGVNTASFWNFDHLELVEAVYPPPRLGLVRGTCL